MRRQKRSKSSRKQPVRKAILAASRSLGIEQKLSHEPATRLQWLRAQWPWAFLALAGVITIAWAIALCWAALALVRWLVG